MSRIYVLVEGQTEEAFLRELLVPHYARLGHYLHPIIVSTSPGYRGGVVSYAKVKPQIVRLCLQDADAYVSTMFDLYALPHDFPGKAAPTYPRTATGHQKALFLEAQLTSDIGQPNFLANLMVHEYEALLFAQPELFSQWSDDATLVTTLQRAVAGAGAPEDINDSPQTAPSKRILAAMPGYQKTFHGPLIACDIGLDAIRQACPHFNAWLLAVEALP
jgi:hypothetical protein